MNDSDHAQSNKPMLSIEPLGASRSFRLVGEMDLSNSCWVAASLDGYATAPGDLTLELEGLGFLDAAGMRALTRLAAKLGPGYRLIARNPGDAVERVLKSDAFQPVPNLVVDHEPIPEGHRPVAGTLLPESGLKARMWGVLGLASLMPMADEVSFTVREGDRLTTPVATGADAADCDSAQYELNDGPCVRAARDGSTEVFAIGEADDSLAPFLETARDRGINAVLSIPVLTLPSKPVGALNLYSRGPGALPAVEIPHAQVLAIRAARLFTAADD
ncbi:MAG TPA: GAF domain-containing protein [Candidatus Polarisedimenticolia bacterium]|jgi:hypothetical protein|nr:GAF domain-containing protein [Candidatus Polarisedimenticolia bacterium]